jgi:beta-galactosidase
MPMIPKVSGLLYGADYNPEQWPEAVWKEDVRLMRECGVNLVHVGIFGWARFNPRPGVFEFEWMDRVLDLLHDGGIAVGLATATASPPAWLGELHPESRPVDAAGQPFWHGSRQNYTPNSAAYQRYALELVEALAERYAKHPALVEWHINNEYGCHTQLSFGEEDALAFRRWLQKRYGSLEALNEAWGTDFWGQRFGNWGNWEEIQPPRQTPTIPNPTFVLDYKRFFSDALRQC